MFSLHITRIYCCHLRNRLLFCVIYSKLRNKNKKIGNEISGECVCVCVLPTVQEIWQCSSGSQLTNNYSFSVVVTEIFLAQPFGAMSNEIMYHIFMSHFTFELFLCAQQKLKIQKWALILRFRKEFSYLCYFVLFWHLALAAWLAGLHQTANICSIVFYIVLLLVCRVIFLFFFFVEAHTECANDVLPTIWPV